MPQSTKYQLKKDQKRNADQISTDESEPEIQSHKKNKLNDKGNHEKQDPIKMPKFAQLRREDEEKDAERRNVVDDPKLQTVIQIVFSLLDETTKNLNSKFKDLNTRISQVENKINGLAHKVRSVQQIQRSSTNTTRGRGTGRGRGRARGNRGGRGRSRGLTRSSRLDSNDNITWDPILENIWDEDEEEDDV